MKIGIQTWGSNGDIRPMIAFGGELVKRGHSVTLSVFSVDDKDYSEVCNKNGINYIRVPKEQKYSFKELLKNIKGKNDTLAFLNILLKKLLFPFVDEIYKVNCELAEKNDILIGHLLMFPLKVAAEKYNKKYISVVFWPGFLKTKYEAPYPVKSKIRFINSIIWNLTDHVFNFMSIKEVNRFYKKELNRRVSSSLNEGCLSQELTIVAATSHLWTEFPDWKDKNIITGSWEIDVGSDIEYGMQKNIENFIENGKKNIFMSLGSPQQIDSSKPMHLLIEAAKMIDANVFLQTTDKRYKKDTIEDNIYFFEEIPHGIILKYCDAAIHHGGAGTTQTVLKYGVPALVIGFATEQMSWGEQICKLGLGEKPLEYRKATINEIVNRVEKMIEDQKYKNNCALYAEKIRDENGLKIAAEIVEKYYKKAK